MASCHNSSYPIGRLGNSSPASFTPSVSSNVTLSLTVCYLLLYCCVFVCVYIQLWLILLFNYKRISFQSVFLFLCLIWSALRATLFSFYFKNTIKANELSGPMYWLLYCFPVCLQFFTLCLLNLYFSQVMFKSMSKYAAHPNKYIIPLRISSFAASFLFLGMNITCAVIVSNEDVHKPNLFLIRGIVITRVLVNDLLFVACAFCLAFSIFKISKTCSANILLEAKGTTVCQATSVGIIIVLLYSSRAVYNLLAISPLRCSELSSFNFDWYNVSDQADLVNLRDSSYILFGVVLFVWELLPTSLSIFFFRVQKVDALVKNGENDLTNCSFNKRVYFFDNPSCYGEEATKQKLKGKVEAIRCSISAEAGDN
ncbi:integral membrane protein GPR137B-like [Ciona intestinalis]